MLPPPLPPDGCALPPDASAAAVDDFMVSLLVLLAASLVKALEAQARCPAGVVVPWIQPALWLLLLLWALLPLLVLPDAAAAGNDITPPPVIPPPPASPNICC